jgi:hypothetical protein
MFKRATQKDVAGFQGWKKGLTEKDIVVLLESAYVTVAAGGTFARALS